MRVSVREWEEPVSEVARLASVGCAVSYRREPSMASRLIRRVFPSPQITLRYLRSIAQGVDLIVISQGGNTDGFPWMDAARAGGYKYAVISQWASEAAWAEDSFAEKMGAAYEGAVSAYFVSQANLELSRRQFGTPLQNAHVVRNPFGVSWDAQPPWPDTGRDELLLACIARLEVAYKGQDVLLQVLNLPHWRERNPRVSLVGAGANERLLRKMAAQMKLGNVHFAGHVSDITGVWSNHHALILPSRSEGMPLALVEAMLCARPCIVTDVGGSRELVRDGISGFIAKAPTVELLDEAMNRAWESRERLKEMGDVAASDVRKWVSADPIGEFADKLEELAQKAGTA